MHPSVAVSRAKIERAETHLEELKDELVRFFGDEPYDIPGDYDPQTKRFTFYFVTKGEPPPLLDVLVGEAAHGLRSALNNLVSALSGGSYGDTDFPIFVSRPDFVKYGKPKIRRLPADVRRYIETLQPYHRSDPQDAPLASLNTLAREDKHRGGTFKCAAFVRGNYDFDAVRDVESYGAVTLYTGRMNNGDPLAELEVVPSGPDPKMEIKCEFAVGIAYGERWVLPEPFPAMVQEVRDIADEFARRP